MAKLMHRGRQLTHFLFLKETVEEMGTGDSGFLALLQEPRNTRFSSLLSKQKQTTMGKKLPGKPLKNPTLLQTICHYGLGGIAE